MSQSAIRMLSIDDKSLTTDLDRAGYKKMGVHVIPVASFADANTILAEQNFDIITINYDYNKIDACIICRHFKSVADIREIPVVITSVQANASIKNKCLSAGADLFIEQPIPRQYFIEKVRSLLEQKVRENKRVTIEAEVQVTLDNGETINCGIHDLSRTGIFLATDRNLESGVKVELSFMLPGYKKPMRVHGEIVRKIDRPIHGGQGITGIGVKFSDYQGDTEKRLEKYIAETQADDPKLAYYL